MYLIDEILKYGRAFLFRSEGPTYILPIDSETIKLFLARINFRAPQFDGKMQRMHYRSLVGAVLPFVFHISDD